MTTFGTHRARQLFNQLCASPDMIRDHLRQEFPETEILDFKGVATTGKTNLKLDKSDAKNFAKALSGFYNWDGGVIVWGIDCEGQTDRTTRTLTGGSEGRLDDATAFRDALERRRANITHPPIPGVLFSDPIASDDGAEILVMYVPPRDYRSPAMARVEGLAYYYFRCGNSFEPVHPDFLAQMLGATPPPLVVPTPIFNPTPRIGTALSISVEVHLKNTGRGAAERPYVRVLVSVSNAEMKVHPANKSGLFTQVDERQGEFTFVGGRDLLLPPGASAGVVELRMHGDASEAAVIRAYFIAGAGSSLASTRGFQLDARTGLEFREIQ